MEEASIIMLAAGILLGAVSVFLFLRGKQGNKGGELKEFMDKMDFFKDSLGGRVSQELASMRQEMASHLGSNREALERSGHAIQKQMLEFTSGVTQMSSALKNVEGSLKEVSSFQDILRTPKLRGQWGEATLAHLLQEAFPVESYELQKYFKSGEAVDAALKIPDGKILPIDSKFPLDNFTRFIQSESEADRVKFKKIFLDDAKREIDSVSQKYILPSEGTTDFALLFIPAESVYYEIVNNIADADVNEYARKKGVLLVSPNTFYLTLQVLRNWLRDVRISRETKEILKRLSRVIQDAGKLEEDFRKLGSHLSNARSSYDSTEKRLTLLVERSQHLLGSEETELLAGAGAGTKEK